MDKSELSLQSLLEQINQKADSNHTHTFIGSIESALSLQGIPYNFFVRNDLKDQLIKAYYDDVSFALGSKNSELKFKAEDNRTKIEVNNQNLSTHNLTITGHQNEDVVLKVNGKLYVNESQVLTANDKGEITGIDASTLDIDGKGIIVDSKEPTKTSDGTIWGQVLDEDLVNDETAIANHTMYTVPVGSIIRTLSTTIPNGYLRLNGQVVSRTGYRGLWEFVKAKSQLVTDEIWMSEYVDSTSKVQKYSYGDGNTTFRLPNMPTGDDTTYMVKAYDELSARAEISLDKIEANIKDLIASKVVTGVGFIKFADGGLVQYGTSYGNTCNFTLPFINTEYAIIPSYEGSATGVDMSITAKQTNKAMFVTTNSTGVILSSPKFNFIAIGRWK